MDTKDIREIKPQYNSFLVFLGNLFSFVFHPLFITTYIFIFLIFIHPGTFTGFEPRLKLFRFLTVFLFTTAFPAFSVFLTWRLKLIQSLYLSTTRERLIPYVLTMFFYFWTWYVFRNLPDSPPVTIHLLLGSFLAICGGWMCNIFFKISMHGIAMGGLIIFALLFAFTDSYSSGLYLSVAVLIAGLVCTSRLIVSDHSTFEVYTGLLVGILAQFIAWLF
ncbi:MAG: hypothetical protein JST75_02845 [Bacteroidetes bacterium]|nr:hypothetical protein [Bacteroidota bacterium]